jgi:hypothetical protein
MRPCIKNSGKTSLFSVREYAFTVRSLYRAGSITTAVRELAKYKLDLVGVQDVRWDKGGTVRAGDYICFYGNKKKIINWEQDFLYTME